MAEGDELLEDFVLLTILAKGDMIEYVVPSVPVFGAKLTEVKLQCDSCKGELIVFDWFAWSCDALDHFLPVIMKVSKCSYKNVFMIKVGEEVALNDALIGIIKYYKIV